MKGLFFFTGSLLRWIVQRPKISIPLLIYYLLIYSNFSNIPESIVNGKGLAFTLALVSPLLIAIGRGLPIDCLDYKAVIKREISDQA